MTLTAASLSELGRLYKLSLLKNKNSDERKNMNTDILNQVGTWVEKALENSGFDKYREKYIRNAFDIRNGIIQPHLTIRLFEETVITVFENEIQIDTGINNYLLRIARNLDEIDDLIYRYKLFIEELLTISGADDLSELSKVNGHADYLLLSVRRYKVLVDTCYEMDPDTYFSYDMNNNIFLFLPKYKVYICGIAWGSEIFVENEVPYSLYGMNLFGSENRESIGVNVMKFTKSHTDDLKKNISSKSISRLFNEAQVYTTDRELDITSYKTNGFDLEKEMDTVTRIEKNPDFVAFRAANNKYVLLLYKEQEAYLLDSVEKVRTTITDKGISL